MMFGKEKVELFFKFKNRIRSFKLLVLDDLCKKKSTVLGSLSYSREFSFLLRFEVEKISLLLM